MLYANIPNFITLARVLSVPVIFWLLINDHSRIAFFVFACAGISDAVDGYLAKRFKWTTELGAYLDPLADKLLIVSIYIALAVSREIPMWLVIAVVEPRHPDPARGALVLAARSPGSHQAARRQQAQHRGSDRACRHRARR